MKDRVIEILERAKAKIQEGWCQNFYARTNDGRDCMSTDSEATSWCLSGAISFASQQETTEISSGYQKAFTLLVDSCSNKNIVHWNDDTNRTKEEVIALYDAAIALCKLRGIHVPDQSV